MNMIETQDSQDPPVNNYRPMTYYQHIDGGVYQTQFLAKSAEDGSVVVIYNHVYPFEQNTWVRSYAEWTSDRFNLIGSHEVSKIQLQERLVFQAEITARRNARKAAKA